MDMNIMEAKNGHPDIENKKKWTLCQKYHSGTVFSVY